jgi:hypothetical protein
MQIAFTLYMIVLFPGGPPVLTNAGTWQNASDCRNAADAAFVPKNTQGEQLPFNLVYVRAKVRIRGTANADLPLKKNGSAGDDRSASRQGV